MIRLNAQEMRKKLDDTLRFIQESSQEFEELTNGKLTQPRKDS